MFLVLLLSLVQPASAFTLKEAFQSARQNMETIKAASSRVDASEEQKKRARAVVLPTVAGVGNYTRIDSPDETGLRAFTLTKQYSAAIRLSQPLIRGGALGALDVAKASVLLAEFQKDATDLNLYQLVINAYYQLRISQVDVKNLAQLTEASRERVKEIRSRTSIGRSRRGELVEAEAQLHTAESQYQQGLINLQDAEQNFEFLTRQASPKIPDLSQIPKVEGSLEYYLSKLKARPDLQATQQAIQVANAQVEVSKGGHYPQVDLVSNYYFDRTGILATSEWDAAIIVSVPLYQGGGVQAAVRESVANRRIAELTASETMRVAQRQLSILYQNYQSVQLQLQALKSALEKAEEAYRLNKKDYQYGLVTNLDVLQSLNVFFQTKRSYDSLYAMAHMTYKNLEASVGVLP
jgi:outer membrane protein TolC